MLCCIQVTCPCTDTDRGVGRKGRFSTGPNEVGSGISFLSLRSTLDLIRCWWAGWASHRQFYNPQNTNWLKVSKSDSFFNLTLSAPLRCRHGKRQYQVYSFRRGCRNHLRYWWQDGKHPCNKDPGPRRAGTVHFNSPGGGQTHQQAFRTSFRVHRESSGHQR